MSGAHAELLLRNDVESQDPENIYQDFHHVYSLARVLSMALNRLCGSCPRPRIYPVGC